jgi:hypothetical protein
LPLMEVVVSVHSTRRQHRSSRNPQDVGIATRWQVCIAPDGDGGQCPLHQAAALEF